MPKQMPSPEDQMMQSITTKWITKPIYAISELGIADLTTSQHNQSPNSTTLF